MSAANPTDLNVLITGYGFAGGWIHGPLIEACPGLRVTGVVTSSLERAALARRRHAEVTVFRDLETALMEGSFDIVAVVSPNAVHVEQALAALRHGAAVVVDKPVAPSVAEAERIRAAALEADGTVAVFHNRRWDGDFLTVRKLVADHAVGKVHRFTSRFDRWAPEHVGWRNLPAAEGGGLLLDLGAHLVDQALVQFGPVTQVYAELATRSPERASDDDVFVALTHASGVQSHLYASAFESAHDLRFHVSGSEGAYVKHGKDIQEEHLLAGETPRPGVSGIEPAERWGSIHTGGSVTPYETVCGDWTGFYAELLAHLRGDGPNPVPLSEAIAVMRVLEAAQVSARDSRVIDLG